MRERVVIFPPLSLTLFNCISFPANNIISHFSFSPRPVDEHQGCTWLWVLLNSTSVITSCSSSPSLLVTLPHPLPPSPHPFLLFFSFSSPLHSLSPFWNLNWVKEQRASYRHFCWFSFLIVILCLMYDCLMNNKGTSIGLVSSKCFTKIEKTYLLNSAGRKKTSALVKIPNWILFLETSVFQAQTLTTFIAFFPWEGMSFEFQILRTCFHSGY